MKRNTKVLLASMASVMLVGTGLAAQTAFAQQGTSSSNDLAQAIASKFHLSQSDVQLVIDQYRTQRQTQRQQRFQDRLNQAVANGSLTPSQRDMVVAKLQTVQQQLAQIRTMTDPVARHSALRSLDSSLRSWVAANKIGATWLRGDGFRLGHDMGSDQAPSQNSPTSS